MIINLNQTAVHCCLSVVLVIFGNFFWKLKKIGLDSKSNLHKIHSDLGFDLLTTKDGDPLTGDLSTDLFFWMREKVSWNIWCRMDFSSFPVDKQVKKGIHFQRYKLTAAHVTFLFSIANKV